MGALNPTTLPEVGRISPGLRSLCSCDGGVAIYDHDLACLIRRKENFHLVPHTIMKTMGASFACRWEIAAALAKGYGLSPPEVDRVIDELIPHAGKWRERLYE